MLGHGDHSDARPDLSDPECAPAAATDNGCIGCGDGVALFRNGRAPVAGLARNQIHVRRRWIRGDVGAPKSIKSAAPVAMAPLLAKFLRAWQAETRYTESTDWVFASTKTHGRTPRVGNMLCRDYLRPAAIEAQVKLEKGRRFGFHNLRHGLASFLITKRKTDLRTAQRSLRHANSVGIRRQGDSGLRFPNDRARVV